MKLSNFEVVNRLVTMLTNIDDALEDTKKLSVLIATQQDDCGGVAGIAGKGHSSYLSQYGDGSGVKVDMSGCYVGAEMVQAAYEVLSDKKAEVEKALMEQGVDVDHMPIR